MQTQASIKVYGGDTIESTDGRVGVIVVSQFNLRGGENVYGIRREGDPNHMSMWNEEDAERRVPESQIARIIKHGQHDYRVGSLQRGHCARCGVAKRDHS